MIEIGPEQLDERHIKDLEAFISGCLCECRHAIKKNDRESALFWLTDISAAINTLLSIKR
jgi:hypothetical protein